MSDFGGIDLKLFDAVQKLPTGPSRSGVSWHMRSKQGGSECAFKKITVPIRPEEIERSLAAIRNAWLSAGQHPNIAAFLGCTYDLTARQFIIATEYVDGLSLREHMKEGVSLPEQVGDSSGLVHTLKHGNFLFTARGIMARRSATCSAFSRCCRDTYTQLLADDVAKIALIAMIAAIALITVSGHGGHGGHGDHGGYHDQDRRDRSDGRCWGTSRRRHKGRSRTMCVCVCV
jgi:hypothetical protein